ncbi:acyltransferase-like protein [Beauveria bassiana ARSEF 2860]|uniref:Acyltransferase-like protein n=1 Tax=Beauveria bassiana (strain ARSEF 2860) TaxID=655819 RepID=J4W799_BEAB2|nr:acyltransferase-like protein [Beauveria bassiana ARSEF 2860]EJP66150.1 acyltransferase-like protein [Beauveria bassiana ARSEF 2860]
MESRIDKRDLLLAPEPQSVYDTAVLCGRYIKNRAVSVSKSIMSTSAAASNLASPRRSPSPSRAGHGHGAPHKPSRGHSATAYLSGVRGVAAVIVFLFHSTWALTAAVDDGYGLWNANHHVLQLPLLRLVHAGHAMVGIFFLIGGYVNAVKPLQLMRERRHAELVPAVAASLLRRGIRLYMPALVAMLATALLTYAGAFEPARRNMDTLKDLFYWPDFHPGRKETLAATLRDWQQQVLQLMNPWQQPHYPHLDPHLWTVTLEFRASLVVSLSLSAVACCRVGSRLAILTLLTLFSLRCDRWEIALFLTGAVLAELDLMRKDAARATASLPAARDMIDLDVEAKRDAAPPPRPPAEHRVIRSLGIMLIALAGMYLMSFPPSHAEETQGFMLIYKWLVPSWTNDPKRYVLGPGAVLFMIAVSSSATLQRPFLTATAQYLGTVSYALYIVHGPVLHSVGYVVTPVVMAVTGLETDREWAMGMVLSTVINFAVALGVADVFYRFVDVGSVRMATAFQRMCFQSGY